MSALVIVPALIATSAGPLIAVSVGTVRLVTYLRSIIPVFIGTLALTTHPWLGTIGYWGQSALSNMTQPLSFAFAMNAASPRAKSAASAWLNVTFWLGNAMAAPLAGFFLAKSDYQMPLFISAGAILLAGLFNEIFFHRIEVSLKEQDRLGGAVKV
jgi:predicted MFS family arabinose efflux permease